MSTILDRPPLELHPAEGPLMYANMTNAMGMSLPEHSFTHYSEEGAKLFESALFS